jgi:hypothetical protein
MPLFLMISPSSSAVMGVSSAGFSTTVQPAASAGASFSTAMIRGEFQGTMAPTTPIRFATRVGERLAVGYVVRLHGNGFADDLRAPAAVVAQEIAAELGDGVVGDGPGHAVVQHLEFDRQVEMRLEFVSQAEQQARALVRTDAGPLALEGGAGGSHGTIDVPRPAPGDGGDAFLGGGIENLDGRGLGWIDPLAADEQLVAAAEEFAGGR